MKYYVEFNVKTGYYIEAENEEAAVDKAFRFYEDYIPTTVVLEATEEEIETEDFY